MEQHPIPQQISSYQFKLVGDMTLKQFFQVAGGVLVGLLFYASNLPGIVKWPIIIISTLVGVALAFLPFEERPLEKWIIAFFRSIYSPTEYYWKKSDKPYVFFSQDTTQQPTIPASPQTSDIYLSSIPQAQTAKNLEEAEKGFLARLTSLWSFHPTTKPTTTTAPVQPATPVVEEKKPLVTPSQAPTVITKSAPKLIVEEKPLVSDTSTFTTTKITPQVFKTETKTASEAEFSIDAAPPNPPTIPNTVVGQVMDMGRKIISSAILEIKDSAGRPVRALRSNTAGHFMIVTPLLKGKYTITTEKEGYVFDPISFEAEGSIIPPIAIKGKVEGMKYEEDGKTNNNASSTNQANDKTVNPTIR